MERSDEVLMTLLKAKERIILYNNKKLKNKDWLPFYNGIAEKVDNIIEDYVTITKMPNEDVLNCLFEVGADHKDSIYYEQYSTIKKNL